MHALHFFAGRVYSSVCVPRKRILANVYVQSASLEWRNNRTRYARLEEKVKQTSKQAIKQRKRRSVDDVKNEQKSVWPGRPYVRALVLYTSREIFRYTHIYAQLSRCGRAKSRISEKRFRLSLYGIAILHERLAWGISYAGSCGMELRENEFSRTYGRFVSLKLSALLKYATTKAICTHCLAKSCPDLPRSVWQNFISLINPICSKFIEIRIERTFQKKKKTLLIFLQHWRKKTLYFFINYEF